VACGSGWGGGGGAKLHVPLDGDVIGTRPVCARLDEPTCRDCSAAVSAGLRRRRAVAAPGWSIPSWNWPPPEPPESAGWARVHYHSRERHARISRGVTNNNGGVEVFWVCLAMLVRGLPHSRPMAGGGGGGQFTMTVHTFPQGAARSAAANRGQARNTPGNPRHVRVMHAKRGAQAQRRQATAPVSRGGGGGRARQNL
jgi:hypothetical protein